jgi:hypothetical protein
VAAAEDGAQAGIVSSASASAKSITSKLGNCACIDHVVLTVTCYQCDLAGVYFTNSFSETVTSPSSSSSSCVFSNSLVNYKGDYVKVSSCKSGLAILTDEGGDYCCATVNTPGACAQFTLWCAHWNFEIKTTLGGHAFLQESLSIYYFSGSRLESYVAWTSSYVTAPGVYVGNSYKFTCAETEC